jgi:hypothetical protein
MFALFTLKSSKRVASFKTSLIFLLIQQLLIRGDCGSVKQYTHFCDEILLKEILMLDSKEKHFCQGK